MSPFVQQIGFRAAVVDPNSCENGISRRFRVIIFGLPLENLIIWICLWRWRKFPYIQHTKYSALVYQNSCADTILKIFPSQLIIIKFKLTNKHVSTLIHIYTYCSEDFKIKYCDPTNNTCRAPPWDENWKQFVEIRSHKNMALVNVCVTKHNLLTTFKTKDLQQRLNLPQCVNYYILCTCISSLLRAVLISTRKVTGVNHWFSCVISSCSLPTVTPPML